MKIKKNINKRFRSNNKLIKLFNPYFFSNLQFFSFSQTIMFPCIVDTFPIDLTKVYKKSNTH